MSPSGSKEWVTSKSWTTTSHRAHLLYTFCWGHFEVLDYHEPQGHIFCIPFSGSLRSAGLPRSTGPPLLSTPWWYYFEVQDYRDPQGHIFCIPFVGVTSKCWTTTSHRAPSFVYLLLGSLRSAGLPRATGPHLLYTL
ncbi:hypothetical protein PoB_005276000 [Plakobranchus ocellatus]|uniref:Uncharacterized protein n=1 Tax=Plakobranchus ocellatus TaxID=259542 RepID=A0AAV4C3Q6_9GAST|nr:hypothetical protein PoB_005276000 [Plakobranchus ocellatus]